MFHLSREFFYRHVLPVGTWNPMLFMTRKTTSAFICLSRLSHKFSHSPLCYIQEADDCHLTSFFWSRNQHQHNQDVRKAPMVDGRSSTNTWRLELWKSSLDSSVKIPFSFDISVVQCADLGSLEGLSGANHLQRSFGRFLWNRHWPWPDIPDIPFFQQPSCLISDQNSSPMTSHPPLFWRFPVLRCFFSVSHF